jgi:hypothetical protein
VVAAHDLVEGHETDAAGLFLLVLFLGEFYVYHQPISTV